MKTGPIAGSEASIALWNFDKYYRRLRGGSAAGVGFNAPAAVGAALAHRKYGRLCVHIQNDGDLMYATGVLWTAAHHKIPLLTVMHNNRAYHQEVMHIQRMADRHERGITHAGIGTTLHRSQYRLRQTGAKHGCLCRRPDQRSEGSWPGHQARSGSRQAG